jgi:hypothetical protein
MTKISFPGVGRYPRRKGHLWQTSTSRQGDQNFCRLEHNRLWAVFFYINEEAQIFGLLISTEKIVLILAKKQRQKTLLATFWA